MGKSASVRSARCGLLNLAALLGAAAAGAIAISGPAAAQRSPLPIVDVHVHVLPNRDMSFDESVAASVQMMDRFGIARSIVMSPPRNPRIRMNYDYADFRAALLRYPGRFAYLAGGGTLNPILHGHAASGSVTETVMRDFSEAARRAIDDGATGFGEMSSLHISLIPQHAYNYVPANHPLLLALADVAAERDVPIDLHMDAVAAEMPAPPRLARFPNNPSRFPATVDALERLLTHNRRARIVWAHGGSDPIGDLTVERVTILMDRHPNLFMSLRVVGPRAPVENKLFAGPQIAPEWLTLLTRHSERFVIGTDSFYVGTSPGGGGGPAREFASRTQPKLAATVRFLALLPPDLARKISSENAVRIYRLTDISVQERPDEAAHSRAAPKSRPGLCRDGNMDHCRIACERGVQPACARLQSGH